MRILIKCFLTLSLILATYASAQDFPNRSIRWIIPYPAGGGTDIVARVIMQKMSSSLGQPIVIDNRPGGSTIIGTQALLSSKPDGYTVMSTAEQLAVNTTLYKNLKYVADNDIDFVGGLVKTPMVLLARADLPVNNAQELIAYLKKNNKSVTYGSWRQGGMPHLIMEAFAAQFPGIEFKLLFSDPSTGMSTILFKMQPGAVVPLHTHMGVEQTYMLEGSLEDDEGKAFEGDFVWRPGGHRHIAVSPKGATFISIFTKPNVFDSGVKFFTEK